MILNEIVAPVFAPLYTDPKHHKILYSGRYSGKSYAKAQLARNYLVWFPGCDVVYCRATAESIGDTIFNEIREKLDNAGIGYTYKVSPYEITTAWGNQVHFKGLDGNKNRTKGNKPPRKYSLVIIDECEEIRSELHLKNAMLSFIRNMDTTIRKVIDGAAMSWQVAYAGNASEIRSFWWNVWVDKHSKTDKYRLITSSWRDISALIPDEIYEEIKLDYIINPQLSRFIYDNDISDLAGGAYPSFRREKHLITPSEANGIFAGETIQAVIFGGDGAIKNDATAISPLAVMSSGRACVLERFIYDPIRTGRPLAPVQYSALIQRYFRWMEGKYHFRDNGVDIYTPIDCAATDLIMQLSYDAQDYYNVVGFTDKKVIQNTAVLNSAFSRNMIYVIDYGGYHDWENWNEADRDPPLIRTDTDILCQQLENVVWKNNKLDPSVPNDVSDSLVYGAQYFVNPQNYEIFLPTKEKTYA